MKKIPKKDKIILLMFRDFQKKRFSPEMTKLVGTYLERGFSKERAVKMAESDLFDKIAKKYKVLKVA